MTGDDTTNARLLNAASWTLLLLGLSLLVFSLARRDGSLMKSDAIDLHVLSSDDAADWLEADPSTPSPPPHRPSLDSFDAPQFLAWSVWLLAPLPGEALPLRVAPLPADAARQAQLSLCLKDIDRDAARGALGGVLMLVAREAAGRRSEVSREPLLDDARPIILRDGAACVDMPNIRLEPLDGPSTYSAQLVSDDADSVAALTRVKARVEAVDAAPLTWLDRSGSFLLLFAMLLRVLAWNARPAPSSTTAPWPSADPAMGALIFIVGVTLLGVFSPGALLRGLGLHVAPGLDVMLGALSLLLIHLALTFGRGHVHPQGARVALALHAPRRHVGVGAALGAGAALAVAANVILYLGGSPEQSSGIQEITRLPGTRLALASMACLSPWYEELFFRGYLQGALDARLGRWIAAATATALFTLIHLPQHTGYLTPLIPILLVAIAASGLRAWSGSTTPCFALHLGYNALLVIPSLFLP